LLISRESQINDFTGLIGSGPAYFFYLLKVYEKHILKLCDGNNKAKDEIIGNLFEGIALSIKGQNTLDELIDAVASKRGTTEAGLNDFKSSKLSKNFEKGIISAIKRSKEISNEF
jgi:pyrroline-5-carboxylate reductase